MELQDEQQQIFTRLALTQRVTTALDETSATLNTLAPLFDANSPPPTAEDRQTYQDAKTQLSNASTAYRRVLELLATDGCPCATCRALGRA